VHALVRPRERVVVRPGPRRPAAAAVILTALSAAVFAAPSASGDRASSRGAGPGAARAGPVALGGQPADETGGLSTGGGGRGVAREADI
jgi:hypothetical protein